MYNFSTVDYRRASSKKKEVRYPSHLGILFINYKVFAEKYFKLRYLHDLAEETKPNKLIFNKFEYLTMSEQILL